MGIFGKLFGDVKTGSHYQHGGTVPLDRDTSLRAGLEKLRLFRTGGMEGKNLSTDDVQKIGDLIEPHLKNLPLSGKLSIGTKQNIRGKLWQMVKGGEISQMDFDDAKKILEHFYIIFFALGDGIQLIFHLARKIVTDVFGEIFG